MTPCLHVSPCPPADHPDNEAATVGSAHSDQGWSMLCNGVIVFDELDEMLDA